MSLRQIGLEENTDKAILGYLNIYESLWKEIENPNITLLEIGAMYGGSLRTWSRYFSSATIVCIEKGDYRPTDIGRAIIHYGDQGDTVFLNEVCNIYKEFDIIIDDGSHMWKDQQASFNFLWPFVKSGGMYIIEDLGTSVEDQYASTDTLPTIDAYFPLIKKVILTDGYEIKQINAYRNLYIFFKR